MRIIRQVLLNLTTVLFATAAAYAHTVWIEPLNNELVIRFAEPGDALETSPGYLDSLSAPVAFILGVNGTSMVESPKNTDHFLLKGTSSNATACVETIFNVRRGSKPFFYARWQPAYTAEAKPLLTLDLVPTAQAGVVRAYFRSQPLGGIKAILRTPDEKEQELLADDHGFIRFVSNQSGQHLLTIAHHREPLAGFYLGCPYERISHNVALTWRQP